MAIAFDATAHGWESNTSDTFAHTCTGTNLILWVFIRLGSATDIITGVTYNGVSMNQAVKRQEATGTQWVYLYYLVGPATGTHNVVISASSSASIAGESASYTGVSQTGQPDATGSNVAEPGTSITTSVTVVSSNCWTISGVGNDGALAMTGSTGVGAVRDNGAWLSNIPVLGDSNGTVGTGSQSMTWTSSSQNLGMVMASFSPALLTSSTGSMTTNTKYWGP